MFTTTICKRLEAQEVSRCGDQVRKTCSQREMNPPEIRTMEISHALDGQK
jgi:hypothetical protein